MGKVCLGLVCVGQTLYKWGRLCNTWIIVMWLVVFLWIMRFKVAAHSCRLYDSHVLLRLHLHVTVLFCCLTSCVHCFQFCFRPCFSPVWFQLSSLVFCISPITPCVFTCWVFLGSSSLLQYMSPCSLFSFCSVLKFLPGRSFQVLLFLWIISIKAEFRVIFLLLESCMALALTHPTQSHE